MRFFTDRIAVRRKYSFAFRRLHSEPAINNNRVFFRTIHRLCILAIYAFLVLCIDTKLLSGQMKHLLLFVV